MLTAGFLGITLTQHEEVGLEARRVVQDRALRLGRSHLEQLHLAFALGLGRDQRTHGRRPLNRSAKPYLSVRVLVALRHNVFFFYDGLFDHVLGCRQLVCEVLRRRVKLIQQCLSVSLF